MYFPDFKIQTGWTTKFVSKFNDFLDALQAFKIDMDNKAATIDAASGIVGLGDASEFYTKKFPGMGVELGSGFGNKICNIIAGRISNTTSTSIGTGDFNFPSVDLGTNAGVWVHIPLLSNINGVFTVSVTSFASANKISVDHFISNSDYLSFELSSTVWITVNIDLLVLGANPEFSKSDLGIPFFNLSSNPTA